MMKRKLMGVLIFCLLYGGGLAGQSDATTGSAPGFDTLIPLSDHLIFTVSDSVVYLNGVGDMLPLALGPINLERWPETEIKHLQRDYFNGDTKFFTRFNGEMFFRDTSGQFHSVFRPDNTKKEWEKRLRSGLLRSNPELAEIKYGVRSGSRLSDSIPLEMITLVSPSEQAFFINQDSTISAGPSDLLYRETLFGGKYHLYYDAVNKHRIIMNRAGETVIKDEGGVLDAVWEMADPVVHIDDYDNLDDKYIYDLERREWLDTVELAIALAPDTYFTASMNRFSDGDVDLFVQGKRRKVTNFSHTVIQLKQFHYDYDGERVYRKKSGDTLWVEPAVNFLGDKPLKFHDEDWLQRGRDSIYNIRTGEGISLPMPVDQGSLTELIYRQGKPVYGWCHGAFIDASGEYRSGSYMMDLERQLRSPYWVSIFHLQDNLFVVRNEKKQIGVVVWR